MSGSTQMLFFPSALCPLTCQQWGGWTEGQGRVLGHLFTGGTPGLDTAAQVTISGFTGASAKPTREEGRSLLVAGGHRDIGRGPGSGLGSATNWPWALWRRQVSGPAFYHF